MIDRALPVNRKPGYLFGMRVKLSGGVAMIRAWDGHQIGPYGHTRIDCELQWRGTGLANYRTIFPRGALYCGVPGHQSIDGPQARALVLSLFAMKPGDADAEYFEGYTAEQLAWADAHGDDLSCERMARFGED